LEGIAPETFVLAKETTVALMFGTDPCNLILSSKRLKCTGTALLCLDNKIMAIGGNKND
jgi:hypothetical protein